MRNLIIKYAATVELVYYCVQSPWLLKSAIDVTSKLLQPSSRLASLSLSCCHNLRLKGYNEGNLNLSLNSVISELMMVGRYKVDSLF